MQMVMKTGKNATFEIMCFVFIYINGRKIVNETVSIFSVYIVLQFIWLYNVYVERFDDCVLRLSVLNYFVKKLFK